MEKQIKKTNMGTNRILIFYTLFLLLAVSCKNKVITTKKHQMPLNQAEINKIKQQRDYQKKI